MAQQPISNLIAWALVVSYCLLGAFSAQAQSCSITLNNNVCPLGVAEDAPFLALPTTCSGKGTCVRGACSCISGWADENCSKRQKRLILGTLAITQAALDEAPMRYLDIVQRVFDNFKDKNLEIPPFQKTDCLNYILKTPLIPNWAISIILNEASVKFKILGDGIQVSADVDVDLPSIPVDAYVSLSPGSGTCCNAQSEPVFQETGTCTEACTASLGEKASVSFTTSLSAVIRPYINETTGELQVDVPAPQVTIAFTPNDLNFKLDCGLTSYPLLLSNLYNDYVQPWGVLVSNGLRTAILEEAEAEAAQYSAATAAQVNMNNFTFAEVIITSLRIEPDSHIIFGLQGFVRKSRFYKDVANCPAVQTIFYDSDDDALLPVSDYFDTFEETSAVGNVRLRTLFEGRVSRSALRAAMWAALLDETETIQSLTEYARGYGILDAYFKASASWKLPHFSFPVTVVGNSSVRVTNTVRFTVDAGDSELICNETGVSQLSTKFNQFSFDLKPFAEGNFTKAQTDPVFSLTGEVIAWDTSRINMNITEPQKISIPNALLKILATQFMKSKLPVANDLLRDRALAVPPSLARFVPGPRLEARHDFEYEGNDGENGYLVASTRCACDSTFSSGFLTVSTERFGNEIIPRCVAPCGPSRRRLEMTSDATTTERELEIPSEVTVTGNELSSSRDVITSARQGHRDLAISSTAAFNDFALSGFCGHLPYSVDEFRAALTIVLSCATTKQLASVPGSSGPARSECMRTSQFVISSVVNSTKTTLPLGMCDATSDLQRYYARCLAPLSIAMPALFDGKPCVEGRAFSCRDTMSAILQANCRCAARNSLALDLALEADCNDALIPTVMLLLGACMPWGLVLVGLMCARCFFLDSEGWANLVAALSFRVSRRSRDNVLINLAVLASFVFMGAVVGWVIQDPLKLFTKSIVTSDLFRISERVESDFEVFMDAWSNCVLFTISYGASQFLLFSLFSLYAGRCIWLLPTSQYMRKGEWIEVPGRVFFIWRWATFVSINAIRLASLLIIGMVAVPPLFFPFRLSVRQVDPQFGETFIDRQFDLAANFTSLSTSDEYMNALVDVVGLSLMSSVIGFISSGVVYVYHGAAPACFAAAQVMIFLMDRKERRDRQWYEQYRTLLPPPDNSELDRWRRIVFLFVWCVHSTGALGSSIAAILLYQVLRAPPEWAVFWLVTWVAPLPLVFLATTKRYRKHHRLIAVGYVSSFAVSTTIMIFYAPPSAGFSVWLAVLLIVAIFVIVFIILLSEFINIADRIESDSLVRERLMQLDADQKPRYKRMNSLVIDQTPAVTGNPLFEHEKLKLTAWREPPPPPTSQPQPAMSEHDMMRMMAAPSATAPIRLMQEKTRQDQAKAMAAAAQRLDRKVHRLSMVIEMDENDIIAAMKKAEVTEQQKKSNSASSSGIAKTPPQSVALTRAQILEKERMKRRISKRLAARGVEGQAAKELTERIAEYHVMKLAVEQQQQQTQRRIVSGAWRAAPTPMKSDPQPPASSFQRLPPIPGSPSLSPNSKPLPPGSPQLSSMKPLPPLPPGLSSPKPAPQAPRSPPPPMSRNDERMMLRTAAAASPRLGGARMEKSPGVPMMMKSTSDRELDVDAPRQVAKAQATATTSNARLDDFFAAQFDPAREKDVMHRAFDGDDSFFGFVKEVVTQMKAMTREAITPRYLAAKARLSSWRDARKQNRVENEQAPSPSEKRARSPTRQAVRYHRRFLAEQKMAGGSQWVFAYNRVRSRLARFFNSNVRPLFAAFVDVVRERKETDDPATYGLRIPGRRLLFMQGLLLMFILLVHISSNRITVQTLKDDAIKLALAASPMEVDSSVAYNWPGVSNVTESLDVPLASYVARATDAYVLMWIIFVLWCLSLVVEIIYAKFGRDMEEKRKGIKLARNISFLNFPLLLVAVMLPCAPDYVGLSLGGIRRVVPECAPKLTATLIGVASNLFGVLAGTYLAFQTMIVLLLIVPSISRALFFVIAREIIDIRMLGMFEPRKAYTLTKKRLQNARFVWRLFPIMSPVLTYLPLLLICQLVGKLYAAALVFTFLVGPTVTAQFVTKPKPEDQTVKDWLVYSTIWILYYISTTSFIVLVESLDRGQVSFVLKITFQSWTWYVKIAAEICLAIVVTSDILYQFMASDAELEADTVINDYFEALEEQAQTAVVLSGLQSPQLGGNASPRSDSSSSTTLLPWMTPTTFAKSPGSNRSPTKQRNTKLDV